MPRNLGIILEPCSDCPEWDKNRSEIQAGKTSGTDYVCDGPNFEVIENCPERRLMPVCAKVALDPVIEVQEELSNG